MTLLSVARHRELADDKTTSDAVLAARIEEAEDMLAAALGRTITYATRLERMYLDAAGWAWPQAWPIASAPGYVIDGNGIIGPLAGTGDNILLTGCSDYADITYTGGWQASDDETPVAGHKIPAAVELDLSSCVQWLVAGAARRRALADVPAGATALKVGDVSVSYGSEGAEAAGGYCWSSSTMRYRYRRL